MSGQHTPGPWLAKQRHLGSGTDRRWVILSPTKGGTHMARLDQVGDFTERDARLIAAAPELLDELINLTARFKAAVIQSGTDEEFAELAVKTARAAIAKATGATP